MDWTQTKNVAEANLATIAGKTSNPKVALTALEKKITGEVEKVEAHLLTLDERVTALPGLLDDADKMVAKVDAVIAKAKSEGRADLGAAAAERRQKHLADRTALEAELNNVDVAQTEADEWLTKLQDKLTEVQALIARTPDARPAPAKVAPPAPAKVATKPAGAKDALDDEFASLLSELDVDLSKVELPKKKSPAKLPDADDGIPDLVTVGDTELPDGEELPPLATPKGKGATAKGAASPAKTPAATRAVPGQSSGVPSKKSRLWLWIGAGTLVLGGGGAALAHFAFGLF